VDDVQHREHAGPNPADGHYVRLRRRGRHLRSPVLPLEPVVLPQVLREGARVPQRGAGGLVPEGQHHARPRAGRRTGQALRAVRDAGHKEEPGSVALQDHGLRRGAPRLLEDRVARAGQTAPDQLDRALRRSGDLLRGRGLRDYRGLHYTTGHALRRHLLRTLSPSTRQSSR
jgi:hypothetical protein